MSEMVERVARAFSDVCLDGCEHQGKADEMRACVDPPCYCRELARVAIAAMREPTEAMKDKGENSLVLKEPAYELEPHSPSATWAAAWACYRAMIDQALK